MKFTDCLSLAKRNVFAYKKTALLVTLSLLVSLIVVILSLAYNHSITDTMAFIVNDKISGANNEISDIDPKKDADILEEIAANPSVDSLRISYLCDIGNMVDKSSVLYFTLDDTSLVAAGKGYPGVNDYTYDFPYESPESLDCVFFFVPFNVEALVLSNSKMISDTELLEYSRKYGGSPLIGREITGDKEIVLSEYILSKYGFTPEQARELIGQKISFKVDNGEEDKLLFDNYTLVGILKTDFFRITSRRFSAQIIVSFSDALFAAGEDRETDGNRFTTTVYSSDYSDAIRANKDLREYGKSVFLTETAALYEDTEMQQTLYNKIILLVAALLIFAAVVYMYSIQAYYFHMRRSFIGLERAVGMKRGGVFMVFLCEFVLMSSVAFIISVPCSLGLIAALRALLTQIMGYSISITFRDFLPAVVSGGVFVTSVTLLFSYLGYRKGKRESILDCLSDTL